MKNTLTIDGLTFRVELKPDDDAGEPWKREDGHGPVSDWSSRNKAPGERVLNSDGNRKRYYDYAGAILLARRDKWGLSDERTAELVARLGRSPTPGEIAARAVEADFQRLKDWCDDRWNYVGVVVTLLDVNGDPVPEIPSSSVWGVESDSSEEYLAELAAENAHDLIAEHEISLDQRTIEHAHQIRD